MKKDKIKKLPYCLFTAEERFLLYIEALYRGDEDEAHRLCVSCPQVIYSMNEVAFVDSCTASKEIVDTLCFALAPRLAKLRMIEVFREALPCLSNICIRAVIFAYIMGHVAGSKLAWQAAGKTGDHPRWKEEEERDEHPLTDV